MQYATPYKVLNEYLLLLLPELSPGRSSVRGRLRVRTAALALVCDGREVNIQHKQ